MSIGMMYLLRDGGTGGDEENNKSDFKIILVNIQNWRFIKQKFQK